MSSKSGEQSQAVLKASDHCLQTEHSRMGGGQGRAWEKMRGGGLLWAS